MTWIPSTAGDIPITIYLKDGSGNEIVQAFILAVVTRPIVTVPPTITSKPTGPAYVGEAWNYNVTATATDGETVKFYLVTPDGETIQEIINGNLSITWETAGSQTLIIRAIDQKDSNGAWSEQKFTIQVVERVIATNDPPVIRSVPNEQIRLGNTYSYKLNVFDPNGDNMTFSLAKSPQGATLSQDGLLSWNPSQIGQYEFEISVSDGINDPTLQKFTLNVLPPVTINTPPVITSILTSGAMKDRPYQYQATATDVDGDTLTWSIDVSEIPESARSDIHIDATTGLFTWTPHVAGSFTFKIIASDGKDSDIRIITLPVASNAPPQITALPEPNGLVGNEYVSKIEAYDPNGDALTYQLENAPEGLTVAADGTLTWTNPVTGRYTVTAIVTDSEGAVAKRQFELRITDPATPNNVPTLDSSLPASIPVNKLFTAHLSASDKDGDVVTFKLVEGPEGMIISSNGQIEWTPKSLGAESFKVEISDGKSSVVYTYTIEVVAQRENHQPQFISEPPQIVTAGKTFTYKPVAADEDNDSVTINIIESPTGMILNAKGEIVWTPSSALVGQSVTVKLRATDTYGASIDQVFEIAVRSVVQAPKVDMSQPLPTGFVGQKMTYQIIATDPQGEKLTYILEGMVRYESYPTNPLQIDIGNAVLDPNSGLLSYTPTAEFADSIIGFRISVRNESGAPTPVMVFPMMVYDLTEVEPVDPGNPSGPTQPTYNNPPQIQLPESSYIEANKLYTYQITAIEPDNDTLTFTLIDPPNGMTINSQTGVITWTPSAGLIDQAIKVSVSVSDGHASSSGYFYLGITAPNNLPTIKSIPDQAATAGSKFQYYVNATDTDRNDTLTYSLNQSAIDLGINIDSRSG
ncbi:MAG: putative Ig domain-containing protein, partial [Planctomycetaceae bacterium]|nr:putative Ig domain-containing protein [Planctomycetaceae bacterium]